MSSSIAKPSIAAGFNRQTMDGIDRKLLHILQQDTTLSIAEMADRAVDVSDM